MGPMINRSFLCLLALLYLWPQCAMGKEPVVFAYQEHFPYMMDGSWGPYGLIGDIVRTVVSKSGIGYKWKNIPISRQKLFMQNNKKNLCIAGATKEQGLSDFGVFSNVIFREKGLILFSKAGDDFFTKTESLQQVLENKNKTLAVIVNSENKGLVGKLVDQYKPNIVELRSDIHHVFKMIFVGRADYVIMTEEEGEYLIFLAKLRLDAFNKIRLNGLPDGKDHYFLCSKNTDSEIIGKINTAIDDLQ